MIGYNSYVSVQETANNQALLEYYTSKAKRKKYNGGSGYSWWLASPDTNNASLFYHVASTGTVAASSASCVYGCAPAFCVQ
jgi:hypothetical protein